MMAALEYTDYEAFERFSNLRTVNISADSALLKIDTCAFFQFQLLESFTVLASTTCLRNGCFKGCTVSMEAAVKEDTAFTLKDLEVSGRDLLERGWAEGPALGAELRRLFDIVLPGDLSNDCDALLEAIRDPEA